MRQLLRLLVLASLCLQQLVVAQQGSNAVRSYPPAAYTPLVYDEDWSYLNDTRNDEDISDRFHYLPIGREHTDYVSFTGQIRERGEYFDHPAWGAQPPDNGYLLQRYLFSGDLHLRGSFRLFCQLGSSLVNGRSGGPRTAIDQQTLSFNQCFAGLRLWHHEKNSLTIRAGRQLVALGSTRLVAIGAGLNVEQAFDGVRLFWDAGGWNVQGLAVRPVLINTGVFASPPDHTQQLWGVYATHSVPLRKAKLDAYFLGYDHAQSVWAQGVGKEQRKTLGVRLYARTRTWYYDWEYSYQFGNFGSGKIRAWSLGTNTGYTFADAPLQPRIEIDAGIISGDRNLRDNTLTTFNSLFPNGSYLGAAVLLGPFNLIIARPKLELHLTRKLTFSPNVEALWRESTTDAIYGAVGYPSHSGVSSSARFVGTQIEAALDWSVSRHTTFSLDYIHFFPGAFLKQSPPGREVNFVAPQISYNF